VIFIIIGACKVYLHINMAYSLKDKRMIIKSLIDRMKNKFNISVSEVELQDIHKKACIGFACVTSKSSHAESIVNNVINFIENNTDAEIYDIQTEIL